MSGLYNSMVFTTEIEISAFVGAIIGVLVGTLAPYYNEKKKLGLNDVDIFFDKKFLKATLVALILAVVGVGGSFPIILANVPPVASILTTVITSAVLAMSMNLGGNIALGPSQVTQDAKSLVVERKAVTTITNTLDDRTRKENQLVGDIAEKQELLRSLDSDNDPAP